MQKEIHEQPDSLLQTMSGRVNLIGSHRVRPEKRTHADICCQPGMISRRFAALPKHKRPC